MSGYWNQVVGVNLTTKEVNRESYNDEFFRKYIGGATAISYFLLKEVNKDVDPLGPENKLIFAAGPITGVPVAGSGRSAVGAKSPLTKAFGKSEVGGYFGAELKRCGIDILIVEGCADEPVYLWIDEEGEIEIRDAKHLWGMEIRETQERIREELDNNQIRTALIGPGGENLVKYACIMNDLKHSAGRAGFGAVMGSKNLKGLAAYGRKRVPVNDGDKVKELNQWLVKNYKTLRPEFSEIGTGATMDLYCAQGNVPTRNFSGGLMEDIEDTFPQSMMENIGVGFGTCYACPIRCKRQVKASGKYEVDPIYGGPEYETLGVFGANCGIADIEAISYANQMCNANTVDVISAGVAIGWAMECYEKGILTKADTSNIDLRFGNAEAMIEVLELIINREGIGKLLAEGVAEASRRVGQGSEEFAMHVKGLELAMHSPRLKHGFGLAISVLSHGGDHGQGFDDMYYVSSGNEKLNAFGYFNNFLPNDMSSEKVSFLIDLQKWRVFQDSVLLCAHVPFDYNKTLELVRAVTGWNTNMVEVQRISERQINLSRLFNIKNGFTTEDDYLPERCYTPVAEGPIKGEYIDKAEFKEALQKYYYLMGWDEDGIPKKITLERLGLEWAMD